MRSLPDRPDLDQLRRQARELQRAAAAGDPDAIRRLWAAAAPARVTLSAAQLAVAREYGFPSWARLKAEVERRRRAAPPRAPAVHLVRPVASLEELAEVFDLLGTQHTPASPMWTGAGSSSPAASPRTARSCSRNRAGPGRRRRARLPQDQGDTGATLRMFGLEPAARGKGLGRRLLETLELEDMVLGVRGISLGGVDGDLKAFLARMGYHGRHSMMREGLPAYGRPQQARLRKLRATAGELGTRPDPGGSRPGNG